MTVKADSYQLARVGPVHFQPLEHELEQVSKYISGRLLNAGCGNRDISPIVKRFGACEVVNYDMRSTIPGAIIGSLLDTPFADGEFDTIVCNAVLEHVPQIEKVMSELARSLKPGGNLIVAIPFLQPFHADPTDFRRYTEDGIRELGELHGLSPVEILPVHTIWQSLGWIAWAWAKEKRGLRPAIVFPLVWIMTRLFNRTDMRLRKNANTFQAVYTK
jgi:SAM-dependent methyltransferase